MSYLHYILPALGIVIIAMLFRHFWKSVKRREEEE